MTMRTVMAVESSLKNLRKESSVVFVNLISAYTVLTLNKSTFEALSACESASRYCQHCIFAVPGVKKTTHTRWKC